MLRARDQPPLRPPSANVISSPTEPCPSGRRCNSRKVVWVKVHRGFKSHRFRQLDPETLEPSGVREFFVSANRDLRVTHRDRQRWRTLEQSLDQPAGAQILTDTFHGDKVELQRVPLGAH